MGAMMQRGQTKGPAHRIFLPRGPRGPKPPYPSGSGVICAVAAVSSSAPARASIAEEVSAARRDQLHLREKIHKIQTKIGDFVPGRAALGAFIAPNAALFLGS